MTDKPDGERRYRGLGVSPGLAVGAVCLFNQARHQSLAFYRTTGIAAEEEASRLRGAVETAVRRLEDLKETVAQRVGEAEAEIFVAHRRILEDPALQGRLHEAVTAGYNAETAVLRTFENYEARLREVENETLQQRAGDLAEIKQRLLDALRNTGPSFACARFGRCQRGRNRVVISRELTPALALEVETEEVLGFVTEHGGVTSHAAILARALGIPAVSGIAGIHKQIDCGTEVLVDGDSGEIVIWPTDATVARAFAERGERARVAPVEPVEGLEVLANISLASEAAEAVAMKAEGIGLYRTEFEFFAAGRLLSEDEQAERYASVVEAMGGRPVYFRMLDIGADKPSPIFSQTREENPALGLRGARFLLDRLDLLRTQARALASASRRGTVHVMYPMITGRAQFERLRGLFNEAVAEMETGRIVHGVMFEVPSACLEAQDILASADFGSIGSNDLIQYLFAVDRNNDRVAYDYSPDHSSFWRLLEDLVRAAEETGKPLSLCGELAADPAYTSRLMQVGIRSVSASARYIPLVRRAAAAAFPACPP